MNLPSRARNGLNGVARELLRQPTVEKPRRQWVDDVVAWCRQHDIDLATRINSKALRFDTALLAQINDVLNSAHLAPLGCSLSGLSSSAQAKEGMEEDKATRESPRAWRILLSLPPQPTPGLASEPRCSRDVDVRHLTLGAFGALVQVENLDSFYTFNPNISALSGYAQPLIAYRGDSHYGGGFAHLAEVWRKTRRPTSTQATSTPRALPSRWTAAPRTCCSPTWRGSPNTPPPCTSPPGSSPTNGACANSTSAYRPNTH